MTRNIEEDLKHRDFTINAMAYDPLTGTLIDPFDGQRDIKRRIIRGVEDPWSRFLEDGLRTYRAIRFSATLGYRIERETLKAIPLSLEKARVASWERVRDEILKILEAKKPSTAFEMMRKTGLLSICLPELLGEYRSKKVQEGVFNHTLATVDAAPRQSILRLACLLHEIGKPRRQKRLRAGPVLEGHEKVSAQMADVVAKRLRLSNHQRKYVCQLIENCGLPLQQIPDKPSLRRFLSRIDMRLSDDVFVLAIATRKASGADQSEIRRLNNLRRRCREFLKVGTPVTVSQLAIEGDEVKEILGIAEGVQVGRILGQLLDIVLEDPRKNNRKDLTKLVKRMGRN